MVYTFYMRNPKTGEPEVLAKLDSASLLLDGPAADMVRYTLQHTTSGLLNYAAFDLHNPMHVQKLPELFNGSYMWVTVQ